MAEFVPQAPQQDERLKEIFTEDFNLRIFGKKKQVRRVDFEDKFTNKLY